MSAATPPDADQDSTSVALRVGHHLRRSRLPAHLVGFVDAAFVYGEMLASDPQRVLMECSRRTVEARVHGDDRLGELLSVIAAVAADLVDEAEA